MTPDNNDTSDTAGQQPANDATAEPSNEPLNAEENDLDVAAASESELEGELVDDNQTNEAGPTEADADDPLGFGDQRMGEDDLHAESDPEALKAQLVEAESKSAEYWDRLLRLQAEMENQRKRAQNDVNKARKFALEGIVGDLLPVKDSLELGLAAASAEDADTNSLTEGAELTLKMLAQVFEKNNILEVNPVDEKFDPEFHQAMSMQEVEGKPANVVTGVMQKGYTLNDRLVRPALVMVSK